MLTMRQISPVSSTQKLGAEILALASRINCQVDIKLARSGKNKEVFPIRYRASVFQLCFITLTKSLATTD